MNLPNLKPLCLLIMLFSTGAVYALEALEDEVMSEATGEGIAFLPENFSIKFDPLAYVRAIPRGVPSAGLKHADVYWYGLSLGAADTVTGATPATILSNATNLSNLSSLNAGAITSWGNAANPWVMRVYSTNDLLYNGQTATVATGANYPVFQYRAPSRNATATAANTEGGLKYAFVGDLQICNNPTALIGANGTSACAGGTLFTGTPVSTNAGAGRLESINVWNNFTVNGSRFSFFQTTVDYTSSNGVPTTGFAAKGAGAGTFGMTFLNRINSASTGVYHFGVAQLAGSTPNGAGPRTAAPSFDPDEGAFFTDLDINLPIGNLHYQPLIFGGDSSGNFTIELVRIPNTPAVYNAAYRDYSLNTAPQLAKMCANTTVDCGAATHGQISIGNVSFKDVNGTRVDLGSASIDGVFIQHLKIRTLGL